MSGRERARVKFMDALQGRAGLCVRCNDNRSGYCGECMEKQSSARVAAAEATITKEAYERGVAEEREALMQTTNKLEAIWGYAGGAFKQVRAAIRARTPSPACEEE